MQPHKDLGPKNLSEFFSKVAESLGGWRISGIILTAVFAVVFKVWTGTNLIPLLFLIGVFSRIYQVNYPMHGMLELITFSALFIAFKYNPFIAVIFSISAFLISRFFGNVEGPEMALIFGVSTAIAVYFVPVFAVQYAFIEMIIIVSAIRNIVFALITLLVHKQTSIFITQTFSALLVGVGLNYGLALFVMAKGWV